MFSCSLYMQTCRETSEPCIKSSRHPQRHWWLHRLWDLVDSPPPSLVSIVELDSEVIEETIHPHTSTPWSPGLWGHSANPAASMTGQTVTRKTRTHTHDISSLVSVSQTASHTHADTHTQAYTLWHFLVKRTSVCSPSHHHHHNQRSFVAG